MPPKKSTKAKCKLEEAVVEKFAQIEDEIEEKENILMVKFSEFKKELQSALNKDINNFTESNPDLANMLLVDYLRQNYPEDEAEDPENEENIDTNRATSSEGEEKTEQTPLGIPKIIRPKKTGFRHPKVNEILFSANGTPINYTETQKILTLTKQCYSEVREVLTCSSAPPEAIPMADFNEVD